MKCKACNGNLTEGEQTLDSRTKELNDMCNVCVDAGLLEHEFESIMVMIDICRFNSFKKKEDKNGATSS